MSTSQKIQLWMTYLLAVVHSLSITYVKNRQCYLFCQTCELAYTLRV